MHTYALTDSNGLCVNILVWDGVSNYSAPSGYSLTQIDNLTPTPGVGWTLSGSTWTAPTPPPPKPDPQGFTVAVLNSSASVAEKSYIMSQLPGLLAELGVSDPSLIEAGWQIIEASGQLSAGTIAMMKTLATEYAIPIS